MTASFPNQEVMAEVDIIDHLWRIFTVTLQEKTIIKDITGVIEGEGEISQKVAQNRIGLVH